MGMEIKKIQMDSIPYQETRPSNPGKKQSRKNQTVRDKLKNHNKPHNSPLHSPINPPHPLLLPIKKHPSYPGTAAGLNVSLHLPVKLPY